VVDSNSDHVGMPIPVGIYSRQGMAPQRLNGASVFEAPVRLSIRNLSKNREFTKPSNDERRERLTILKEINALMAEMPDEDEMQATKDHLATLHAIKEMDAPSKDKVEEAAEHRHAACHPGCGVTCPNVTCGPVPHVSGSPGRLPPAFCFL
jgi:hypothetical protein